ncbi:MAG: tetratricopeptide repeat protein [Tepidisphaeraceae bacterium]
MSEDAQPHFARAAEFFARRQYFDAAQSLRRGLAIQPVSHTHWFNLGAVLNILGDAVQAQAALGEALRLVPDFAEAHLEVGFILTRGGQLDLAASHFARAALIRPDNAQAHNALGVVARAQSRHADAINSLRRAISLDPRYAEAHSNLATVLADVERFDEAFAEFERAISLQPGLLAARHGYANALFAVGRFDESTACLRRIVEMTPNDPVAHSNLATALRGTLDLPGAMAEYDRALALAPDDPEVRLNRGIALLMMGDYERGFADYEFRLRVPGLDKFLKNETTGRWDGAEATGKTILVRCEQGFGDAIQFARFLPVVARRCDRVVVVAQPSLVRLIRTVAGVAQVVSDDAHTPKHDLHVPMMSLAHVLRISPRTLPSDLPYFQLDATAKNVWSHRLSGDHARLRVGLAWAGSKTNPRRLARDLPLGMFTGLAALGGVVFYSLRFGSPDGGAVAPPGMRMIDHTAQLHDFADTAGMMQALDLIISVDTATAHLAGALDRPVWVILSRYCDWRWMLDEQINPWYPSMRLFRQHAEGDWRPVFERLELELSEMLNRPR